MIEDCASKTTGVPDVALPSSSPMLASAKIITLLTMCTEITQTLYLSLATVKTHVRRIMEKLPAENRVQVAICVHEAGPPAADD
ncbi:LuxR C-terminal-related transcriptional regulator [Microbacterium esteraromaticum]|uniref:LuxR C-terminal-related transcriptional regulator n=1 Tax=Microbacterium esteraromaticum TaxID=57043 RepID=UPI001C98D91F|nr:LuxR C-terminal-related transcriptional regulator [Microbacterium esteraromaticum]MBY6061700.1 LuxR C-terminal-related transcriptional regulator [Microbacterium esteraromaticum]